MQREDGNTFDRPSRRVLESAPGLVADRSCGACTMCCKLFEIRALDKPAGLWCAHCKTGAGCGIYEQRPRECRDFFCHYRLDRDVPEHWKPSRSHMVLLSDAAGVRIVVHVDPKRPVAWREGQYYRDLKSWSANRLTAGKQVHVRIGARTIVVLPDRDVDLGEVGDDQAILTTSTWTPAGPRLNFEVVPRDDPRVRAPAAPSVFRR